MMKANLRRAPFFFLCFIVLVTTNAVGQGFIISSGTNVKTSGDISLVVQGTWSNSGTYSAGTSTTNVFSVASQEDLTGSTTFYDVRKTGAANLLLGDDMTINGTCTMAGGHIETGSNTLTLGTSALLNGECTTSRIIGTISTSRTVGTSASTFGGIGVALDAGTDDIGSVIVTRVTGPAGIVTGAGNTGIASQWTLIPTAQPTSGRNLTLQWFAVDDNGKNVSSAQMWQSTNLGSTWSPIGAITDVSGSDPRCFVNAVTSLGGFTVSDASNPVPVELVAFSAHWKDAEVLLQWKTATELNNFGFEIERDIAEASGRSRQYEWKTVGFVMGSGTSAVPHKYHFIDAPPLESKSGSTLSYRLRQLDRDGKYSFSPVVEVRTWAVSGFSIALSPNPLYGDAVAHIEVSLPRRSTVEIQITDLLGRRLMKVPVGGTLDAGSYNFSLPAMHLPTGMYYCTVWAEQNVRTHRFTVQR